MKFKSSLLRIIIACVCLILESSLGSYVSDLNPNTDCKSILAQKAAERSKNSALANKIFTSSSNDVPYKKAASIFDFIVKDTYLNDVILSDYCRDFVTITVNTASSCVLTDSNYAQLNQLNKNYGNKLRILTFPSNQFMQMSESDGDEMLCHFKLRNIVPGMILAKINVNGNSSIPLYKYLKYKLGGGDIEWNFVKFLVNKSGQPVKRYGLELPMDILEDIKTLF